MSRLADVLQSSAIFGCLSQPELDQLAGLGQRRSLEKGEALFREGDHWPFALYIASGSFRSVINAPDGRSYIVSTWNKGEDFWGHTLFDQEPMPSTLEATQTSHVYIWDGHQALELVLKNPEATRMLLRRQTQLIRKRRENIYNLAFSPVAGRLAKLIISKFADAEGPTVQRDLTLSDMAEMVATSPEVVCRLLYQFQANGTLSISRATITLHDRQALERLSIPE
jgi:CRP/FNR family transcriptional regulator